MRLRGLLLGCALLCGLTTGVVLTGCRSNTWAEPRDKSETDAMLEGRDRPSADQIELEQQAPSVPTQEGLQRFTIETLRNAPPTGSILCLPLVTLDAREGVRVTELGVDIADRIARELVEREYGGQVLSTLDATVMAAKGNVDRATLSSLPAVREHGVRFGTDVIVFGQIRRDRSAGDVGRNSLRYDVSAFDILSESVIARESWEVSNRTQGTAYEWTRISQPSAWQPESKFAAPGVAPRLGTELEIAAEALARRIAPALKAQPGKVYVAPLDTAQFVRAIAYLRSAQAIFADEYDSRVQQAAGANQPLELEKPLTIHDTEFASLQAARAYLTRLRETLQTSPAARFGEGFSNQLGQSLQEQLQGRTGDAEISVTDLGFTEWSDTQLVEGQLALGGLARSKVARDALQRAGVRYVVQPRLEKISSEYLIRVQVLDVEQGQVRVSTHFPLQERFAQELAAELAVPEQKMPEPQPQDAPRKLIERQAQDWSDVYEKAVRAAVMVASQKGWGSGFLVEGDYVLTNYHVVDGLRPEDGPVVIFADKSRSAYDVVASDKNWDVAVLKPAQVPAGVGHLRLAEADVAAVGKAVAVLGRPKETLGWVLSPGYLSSLSEMSPITKTQRWMYTCPTRGGNSGSPVLLADGSVISLHSEGSLGNLGGSQNFTELTGFARGVPIGEVRRVLESAGPSDR